MKVEKVLPSAGNSAVLEIEDDTALDIQVLAVAHSGVSVDTGHPAVIIRHHVAQLGLEGASGLATIPAKLAGYSGFVVDSKGLR